MSKLIDELLGKITGMSMSQAERDYLLAGLKSHFGEGIGQEQLEEISKVMVKDGRKPLIEDMKDAEGEYDSKDTRKKMFGSSASKKEMEMMDQHMKSMRKGENKGN